MEAKPAELRTLPCIVKVVVAHLEEGMITVHSIQAINQTLLWPLWNQLLEECKDS